MLVPSEWGFISHNSPVVPPQRHCTECTMCFSTRKPPSEAPAFITICRSQTITLQKVKGIKGIFNAILLTAGVMRGCVQKKKKGYSFCSDPEVNIIYTVISSRDWSGSLEMRMALSTQADLLMEIHMRF